MRIADRILLSTRDKILQSRVATRVLEWPISTYRQGIYHFGPDYSHISVDNGPKATFHSSTREEIRHFYPVYGEMDNLSSLVNDLQPDDILFDIGAHIGIYSCIAAQKIGESQVFAFEPHPANVDRLAENAMLNDIDIQTYQCALSDTNATKAISIDADEAGAVGHSDSSVREQQVMVDFIRGAELVSKENIPHPTVIKIDIEGAELAALRGLDEILEDCRAIYCEVSDRLEQYGDSQSELLQWLDDRDFKIESLGKGGVEHDDIRAVRP